MVIDGDDVDGVDDDVDDVDDDVGDAWMTWMMTWMIVVAPSNDRKNR